MNTETPLHLLGTTTSPFVRRVRVVLLELGLPFEMENAATEAGQARVRERSPTWKIPLLSFADGLVLWDSHAINQELIRRHGWGGLRPTTSPAREDALRLATDAALEAGISRFYLQRDGLDVDAVPYMRKQRERMDVALGWLANQLDGPSFDGADGLGLPELALVTALDWMAFRGTWPVAEVPAFERLRAAWRDRPSLAATPPRA